MYIYKSKKSSQQDRPSSKKNQNQGRSVVNKESKRQRKTRQEIDSHLSLKKSETMEVGLQVQIKKLEAKLKRYQRDNEELQDINTKSEMLIKLHKMQKERKEQIISDQNNHTEKLSGQIKKLKDKSDFNQKLTNQDIKKEISDYEAKTICLNKIINNKDEELTHIRQKLTDQESVVDQYRQQKSRKISSLRRVKTSKEDSSRNR